MLRRKRKRAENPSGSAAGNVAAAQVGSITGIQAGEGGERPLGALAPETPSASVKSPFARGSSSGTLGRMSSPIRLAPLPRRLLTNRWSGRVRDKVPSSYTGVRAAQLNR
jgi:hypothetical protein